MLSPTPQWSFLSSCLKTKSISSSSSSLQHSPWSGLETWRKSPLNENRFWGPKGPQTQPSWADTPINLSSASSLAELGALVLSTSDPLAKCNLSHLAYSRWRQHSLPLGACEPPSSPARPLKPQLVSFLNIWFLGLLGFTAFQFLNSDGGYVIIILNWVWVLFIVCIASLF